MLHLMDEGLAVRRFYIDCFTTEAQSTQRKTFYLLVRRRRTTKKPLCTLWLFRTPVLHPSGQPAAVQI